jgi:sugar fermentation stimulation protein
MECFNISLVKGTVINRPSKICKSPYVADVLLDDGSVILAHAPSLGCNGMCNSGSIIYLSLLENPKKCSHVIYLSEKDNIVGIHPKCGEKIVEYCLNNNYIDSLKNLKELKREQKVLNSRFDFIGVDSENNKFILEVKSVPLCENKVAYFPEGYRKKKTDVISPRALKHIQELKQIKLASNIRTIICFVIQNSEAEYFKISDTDIIYKNAVNDAINEGVEIIALKIVWNIEGKAYFYNKLPIKN